MVLGVALVLLTVLPSGAGGPPRGAPATRSDPAFVSKPASDARSVVLTASAGSVAAGAAESFSISILPDNCTGHDQPNRTVTKLVIVLGDGYVFEGFGWPGDFYSGNTSCQSAPWNVTIPFSYAYHDPGTYQATATVTWADGAVRNSTAVAVTVVGAADVVSPLTEWLIAASVVVGAALVACYLLRHRLPESPSLPPRKA